MRKIDNRRMKFAWLLMWVYLPMLLAITFHHHAEVEGSSATFYCYDCAHHINHDGHLTAEHGFVHDCALCQLHDLPYVVGCSKSIIFFCMIFDLDKEAFC